MPSNARVVVVALDAADPGLVRELARAGEMPALAGFLKRAAMVRTRAPMGVFVSANWPTVFTARSPDRHGYLCWNEYVGGTYDYRETDPTMIRGTPFWETASEAGQLVCGDRRAALARASGERRHAGGVGLPRPASRPRVVACGARG
jgi:predicted AlkP superfamily phosphohydrolase/phosphomutase